MRFGFFTCKDALARMNDYLDRKLTPSEMQAVRRHVKLCHACALKFASEARLLEETRTKLDRIQPEDEMIARMSNILEEVSRFA